jgi:predicted ATPase/DNA-binding CsgD family transcriptional regulator
MRGPVKRTARIDRLPSDLTSFVGRHREVVEVRRLLSATRLVTLTGPGGVGKTRLALRVAAEVRRAYADGVCQVDLGQTRDPSLLWYRVADALGLRDQTDRPLAQVVTDFLSARQMLLVLDNCEHLLGACAELVSTILSTAPWMRVLCTSREAVGSPGEHVWMVPPMAVPDPNRPLAAGSGSKYAALALFAERAAVATPGFSLTPHNEPTVAAICQQLDGLPLAIELAAARLRALSVHQIAARLHDRFGLLAIRRAVPARHRTLQGTFDWSYELCSPQEQAVWATMSVFLGSFDLNAIAYVCADDWSPDDVLSLVAGLIDKSVLIREDGSEQARYWLLETVREYGLARLSVRGDASVVRRRHRDYYLRLAERAEAGWLGSEQERMYATLRREHANLRGALNCCFSTPGETATGVHLAATLWFYWMCCGLQREGRYWLDQALSVDRVSSPSRRKALWATGAIAIAQADMDTTVRVLTECRDDAVRAGDENILAFVGLSLGLVDFYAGDYQRAAGVFEEALERFKALGTVHSISLFGELELAWALAFQGDLEGAGKIALNTLNTCGQIGERWTAGNASHVLALVAMGRGDIEAAMGHAQDCLRVKRHFHDLNTIALILETYAALLVADGAAGRAAVVHGAAGRIWQTMGRSDFGSEAMEAQHEQAAAQARQAIGDEAYEIGVRGGAALDFDEAMAYALADTDRAAPPDAAQTDTHATTPLTRREWQVAALVAEGLSNKQVAHRLVIAQRTAESHVQNILRKLGFTSRARLVAWFAQRSR